MPFTLDGRVAIVTGAGRGIGRAIASRLASTGAAVVINDLDEQAVTETADAIRADGAKVEAIAGDVTAPAFPQKLVDAAVERFEASTSS